MLLVSARCQTITDWFIVIVSMIVIVAIIIIVMIIIIIVIVAIIVIIVIFVCSRRAGLPRQPSAPRPSSTAKIGPWQRFLQAKRKGTKCTMKEIADQWGQPLCGTEEDVAATSSAAARARASAGQASCPGQQRPFRLAEVW